MCRESRRVYYANNKEKVQKINKVWSSEHRQELNTYRYDYGKKHKEREMFNQVKSRAKRQGKPFRLMVSDIVIPEICPALGIPLIPGKKKLQPNSPSIDAIIPELGYIPGNIAIISMRANSIKQNATHQEIRKVADWLESVVAG